MKEQAKEHESCASWVADGECENNEELMARECPTSCARRKKTTTKAKQPALKNVPPGTPPDTNENCAHWAASGECDQNAVYMRQNCATSCASGYLFCPSSIRCCALFASGLPPASSP